MENPLRHMSAIGRLLATWILLLASVHLAHSHTLLPGMVPPSGVRGISLWGERGDLAVDPGSISAPQTTICAGAAPALFASDAPATGHDGYLWEYSTDGGASWSPAPGTNDAETYQPGSLTETTAFRRMALSAADGDETSNEVAVTVADLPDAPSFPGGTPHICSPVDNPATLAELDSYTAGQNLQWYDAPTGGNLLPPTTIYENNKDYYASQTVNGCESATRAKISPRLHAIGSNTVTPGAIQTAKPIVCRGENVTIANAVEAGSSWGHQTVRSYQWEYSTDGGATWQDSPGGNAAKGGSLTVLSLQDSTTFRRRALFLMSGQSSCEVVSNEIFIKVNWADGGEIAGSQGTCWGEIPSKKLTNVQLGDGAGKVTYRWVLSPYNQTVGYEEEYQPVQDVNGNDGFYRVAISDLDGHFCEAASNMAFTPTVALGGGTIGSHQTVCEGDEAGGLTSETAAKTTPNWLFGQLDTITYQWQKAVPGGEWIDIPNETGLTLDAPGAIYKTTLFRRKAISTLFDHECEANADHVTVTVNRLSAGTITGDRAICAGQDAGLFTSKNGDHGFGGGLLLWEKSPTGDPNGSDWEIIPNQTGLEYFPGILNADTWFRRGKVGQQNDVTCRDTSNVVKVSINHIAAGEISASQIVCPGGVPAEIVTAVPATGLNTPTYEWYRATNGSNWTKIDGATGETYQPGAMTATAHFRRRAFSSILIGGTLSFCQDDSNPVTITVNAINPGAIGGTQTVCEGIAPLALSSSSAATGAGDLSYRWERSTDGWATFDSIPGTDPKEGSYSPGVLAQTTAFRRVALFTYSDGTECEIATVPVTVTVNWVTAGTIAADQTVCTSGTPDPLLSITSADGAGTISWAWRRSTDGGTSWNTINGQFGADYTPPALTATTLYQRVATSTLGNSKCPATSAPVTITIHTLQAGSISASHTICEGAMPNLLASDALGSSSLGGTVGYYWQRKLPTDTDWADISGATAKDYQPDALFATTQFRRVVVSTAGGKDCETPSSPVTVTVRITTAPTGAAEQVFCAGDAPTVQDLVVASGASIRWYADPTGGIQLPGTTPLADGTFYYASRTANGCEGLARFAVRAVLNDPDGGMIADDRTICAGDPAGLLPSVTEADGKGILEYYWQRSTNGGASWTKINLTDGEYAPGVLTQTTIFRRVAVFTQGGVACTAFSNEVTVTVNKVASGTVVNSHVVCPGTTPNLLTSLTDGSGSGTISHYWQQSTDGGTTWDPISGPEDAFYQPPVLTATTQFQRVAVSTTATGSICEAPATPLTVTLNTVNGGTISADQTICEGAKPNPLVSESPGTGESNNITYRWERSTDGGATWTTIPGATSLGYTPGTLSVTTMYQRVAVSTIGTSNCESPSNPVTITVTVIAAPTGDAVQTFCGTGATIADLQTVGDNVKWYDAPTGGTLLALSAPLAHNATYYASQTDKVCESVARLAVKTALNTINPGSIGGGQTVCLDAGPASVLNSASGATGASGADFTYRWEYSTDGGANWIPITGTPPKVGSYAPGIVSETTQFRRMAVAELNGLVCQVPSAPVTVTVNKVYGGSISADQTICEGGTPDPLLSGDPGGGDGTLVFRWERSTDGGTNWTQISGAIGAGYTPDALTVTTQFRRVVVGQFIGGNCRAYSNPVTITVNEVDAGTIGANQTICEGAVPAELKSTLDGSSAAGGTITYQWQRRPQGGAWADIAGATLKGYQPMALLASTEYRRIAIASLSGADCRDTTAVVAVTVTVTPAPTGLAVQTFCAADAPTLHNLSVAGTGIRWYDAPVGGTPLPATVPLVNNTTYYASRTANGCESLARLAVTAMLNEVDAGSISADQTICHGTPPDLLGSAQDGSGVGTISHYWQRSTDGGANWTAITGATAETYQPDLLAGSTMFHRVAVSTMGNNRCEAVSAPVAITMNWAVGGSISSDRTVCTGATPVLLTSTVEGGTAPGGSRSYRWEQLPDGETDWMPIAGAEEKDYLPNVLTVTTQFRRVAISTLGGKKCEDASNVVTITVNHVDGGAISGTQTVCFGTSPLLLSSVQDGVVDGIRSYYWEMFPDGASGWTRIPGATDKDYLPDPLLGETKYRRVTVSKLNDVACEDPSGEVTVTVTVAPAPTGQATQIFCADGSPTVADLQAIGLFVRWYDLPTGGTPLSTLRPLAHNTAYYASQAVDGCESAARLKVTALLNTVNPGTITGEQTICSDTRPAMLGNSAVAKGIGSITYRWESSTDGWLTWDIIPGTVPKVATYWPPKLTVTTEFRRVAIATSADGACEAVSVPVTVWVNDVYGGAISDDQTICEGSVPNTLVSDILPDGNGNITYHWESSTNGTSWAKISGAEAEEYTPGPLTVAMMFRRVVTSDLNGRECTDPSNDVIIMVNHVDAGAIGSGQTICEGETPAGLTSTADGSSASGGSIAYQWEHSTDGGATWHPAPGMADGKDYQPVALTVTTTYRRVTSSTLDGVLCKAFSNEVTVSVTVLSAPTGNAVQTFCEAEVPTLADLKASGSGLKWYDVPVGGMPLPTVTELQHNKIYYASRMAAGCESVARLEVTAMLNGVAGGAISTDQTICAGDIPDLLLSDMDGSTDGAIGYYWQRSTDGGTNWTTIAGATIETYQPDALFTTHVFRRMTVSTMGNNACEALSNEITIRVNSVSAGSIAGNQTVCLGTPPKADLTSTTDGDGAGSVSYYWERSTDGGANWTPIHVDAATYLPALLAETTLFRRVTVSTIGSSTCEAVSNEVTVTVLTNCDVESVKTVADTDGNKLADGGEELTYTITVTNNFDRPVTVTVVDALPANTEYLSSSAGGTYRGGNIAWHNATVPANAAGTFTFVVKVTDNLTGISEIRNTATVTGDPAEIPTPLMPEANISTNPRPAHTAVKTVEDADGDGLALAEEELTYTITVANTGSVDLMGVAVSDLIPAGTRYVPGSVTGGGVLTTGTPDRLDWTFDLAFGAQAELTFRVKTADDLTGFNRISNTATVRGEATLAADIPTHHGGPSMGLKKELVDPSKTYALGDLIAYHITVRNTGSVPLDNVVVTDPNADSPNVGSIPILAPGASKTFPAYHEVTEDDVDAGRVDNTAAATAKDPDGNDVKAKSKKITAYVAVGPGMSVAKKVVDRSKIYGLGDIIAYTITVTNTGDVDLTDITVTDPNADSPNVGTILKLAPGGSETFTAQHTVNEDDVEAGRVDNIATAVGKDPDGNDVTADSKDPDCSWCPSTGVPVDQGDSYGLVVTKTADRGREYAKVGDVIVYTIMVTNTGNDALTEVTLVDHNADGNQGQVKYEEIQPGRKQLFIVEHTVTQDDIDLGYVYNVVLAKAKHGSGATAGARSSDTAPCGACPVDPGCPDCTIVPIKREATITLIKDVVDPKKSYAVGDRIKYAIKATNAGNVRLRNIVVTDENADDRKVGTIPVLAPGSSDAFTAYHTITQEDMDRGHVLNIALAKGKDPNGSEVTAESRSSVPYDGDPIDPLCPNCTVVEFPKIEAVDDLYEVTWSDRSATVGSVLDNDELGKQLVNPADVVLEPLVPGHSGLWMDPDGMIVIDPSVPVGRYEYTYSICEAANPNNCSNAVAVVHILADEEDEEDEENPNEEGLLVIPDVFTPNGDGINDAFEIGGIEHFDRVELVVLNRWGNEVYRDEKYRNDWRGIVLNNGTYYYVVTGYKGDRREVHKGNVLIMK